MHFGLQLRLDCVDMASIPTTAIIHASKRRRQAARKGQARDQANTVQSVSAADQDFIEAKLKYYDKDNSNSLDASELKQLMRDLNDGIPPGDNEVEAILKQCDADGSGKIDAAELRKVIVIWFASVEGAKHNEGCGCAIT